MKQWEEAGFTVLRTAGSHGFADLVAVRWGQIPCLIQCKCLKGGTKKQAETIIRKFLASPPMKPSPFYSQVIAVYAMTDRSEHEGAI